MSEQHDVCRECGAVVDLSSRHRKWHESLKRRGDEHEAFIYEHEDRISELEG